MVWKSKYQSKSYLCHKNEFTKEGSRLIWRDRVAALLQLGKKENLKLKNDHRLVIENLNINSISNKFDSLKLIIPGKLAY